MALTTYAELIAAVPNWLQRTDLTATIPDFVTLFEAWANRKLQVRQQQATTNLTPTAGAVALPSDYLTWTRLTYTGNPRRELQYVEPSILQAMFPERPNDVPSVFTIEGTNIQVMPIDVNNTVLEFVYFQKVPSLQVNSTNWLMTAHPDLYLFGVLTEAQSYAVDTEQAAFWKMRRDELFDEMVTLTNRSRAPGSIRPYGPTP